MKETIKNTLRAVGAYKHYQLYRDAWYQDKDRQIMLESFNSEMEAFYRSAGQDNPRFPVQRQAIEPHLTDKTDITYFDTHYIYHPAWAARVVQAIKPDLHIDIASTLHFASIVSAFVPVRFYDYRPAPLTLTNLETDFADLLALPFPDGSVASLSCMHTVEHVGLGRYGDPLDYDGDLKAIKELKRVTATGGSLLFVVPVGQSRIVFNAHRIYAYEQVMDYFGDMELVEYMLIPDDALEKGIIVNATREQTARQQWGCGCFWFRKK